MNISLDGFYQSLFSEGQWRNYLEGLKITLLISFIACLMGIVIGLVISLIKYKYQEDKKENDLRIAIKFLNALASFYTTVIRGTPVLLQLLILYAVALNGGLEAAIIGFGINSGAYVSEIIRGGLASVDEGQKEAGRSLGLSSNQTMWLVIVPQAFKNIVPALFNE
ncbi:MAG: amino acid ABC transporter permease, partial [Erysipelothrix sp.]|nr:amino acid ABC transporter permease [Erysipelothrix sp.]